MVVMFERVVVAIDGSEEATRALDIACDLASKYNSRINLVHSPQLETTVIVVGSSAVAIKPDPAKIEEAGRQVMDAAIARAKASGQTPEHCVISNGDPAGEILNALEAFDADLVVMGRRGLGRVSSVLLGSVSQKVCHDAKCTCMTVC